MKKGSLILSISFVLIVGLLSVCGGEKLAIGDSAQEVKVGLNLELTGPLAYYGQGSLNGILMAFDEINQDGGINGIKITPIIGDNRSDSARVAYVADRLITQNGVVTTIGPATSYNFTVTIPAAMEYKIPTISSNSSADIITVDANGNPYEYVFRTISNDSFQGTTMANFALNNLDAKKAVEIEEEYNVTSEGLVETFTKAFEEGGGTIVSKEIYQKGDTDFTSMLTKIKQKEFDVIFLSGYYEESGLIIKQARKLGITAPILASDAVDSPVLLELAGPTALNNVYIPTDFSSLSQNPLAQTFIEDYEKKYGREPISADARGYDAGYFIADAIKRAGSTDPEAIKNAYASTENFTGVTGTFSMGQDHNAIKSIAVIRLENGVPTTSVTVKPK